MDEFVLLLMVDSCRLKFVREVPSKTGCRVHR